MMCTLLTTGDRIPDRIAPVLASFFGLPISEVDICDLWDLDSRNWDASVTCEYAPLSGDLSWSLAIATSDDTSQLTEEVLALTVARELGVVVVFSSDYSDISWIDRAATPEGDVCYINTIESEDDPPRWTVAISEIFIPAFPEAEVRPIPEIIKPLRLPTPITDACVPKGHPQREAFYPLVNWERLTARMAADWPPSSWYPASMYVEDLELRDQLDDVIAQLSPEDQQRVREATAQVDRTYRSLTHEDGGENLARATGRPITDRAWYWYRRPPNPPWDIARQ
ncbi:hypothetical protein SAMN05428954_5223 [Streptomyces sp. 2112.3]|uniref:hypothetical protein n=1 Tax=Streptomyces sp. 2112.3 TaxID=1881023 RepID=UPI00089499B0|nr:hypothetical protein [Streptomyces sp. 2112.3]SEF01056.1 hypothetical protein SAMN05428954_5223 [Streptomyces sp. 2112.3]